MRSECLHIRQLLSDYIDRVLDPAKTNKIREHLQSCEDCNREHEGLNALISELRNIRAVKAPEDFLEKFHERIRDVSFVERIMEILSFRWIKFPVEMTAFAATAALILLIFHFIPSEQTIKIAHIEKNSMQAVPDKGGQTNQAAGNPSLTTQAQKQRPTVKLALSLIARQAARPIPSQSVSFGGSGSEYQNQDMLPTGEDYTADIMQPYEVNSKIDEIISSVGGKLLSGKYQAETGYPAHLTLDIPVINYDRFVSKIKDLCALESPAPALPDVSEDKMVLIQMEFTTKE